MNAAQQLRSSIEAQLSRRIPAALSPQARSAPELRPLGIPEIDGMLGGGLPVGALVELVGSLSSGRSSCAQAFVARVLAEGNVAAWIDVSDALDPESAAANGVDLSRLLWVRCGDSCLTPNAQPSSPLSPTSQPDSAQPATGQLSPRQLASRHLQSSQPSATQLPTIQPPHITPASAAASSILHSGGCGSPHPRGEGRGLPEALNQLLAPVPHPSGTIPVPPQRFPSSFGQAPGTAPTRGARRIVGTPGAPNLPLADTALPHAAPQLAGPKAREWEEQAPARRTPDHLPNRRLPNSFAASSPRCHPPELPSRQPSLQPFDPRPLSRQEQVSTDRQPARRGTFLLAEQARHSTAAIPPRRSEKQSARRSLLPTRRSQPTRSPSPSTTPNSSFLPSRSTGSHWKALDQALRAADLVLAAGGFATLVLDLGSLPPETVNRIPLASWFRFRAAAERSRCTVLLLTQHPCAQSSAEVILRTHIGMPEAGAVLAALPYSIELVRQRFRPSPNPTPNVIPLRTPPPKKQPQSVQATQWQAPAMWARR